MGLGPDGDEQPSRIVLVDLASHARVATTPLAGANVSGDVAWAGPRRLVFLPGGGDADDARVYDRSLRLVGRFERWSTTSATVVGERAYGLTDAGTLVSAVLPRGPVRVVRELPSPVARALAAVRAGPIPQRGPASDGPRAGEGRSGVVAAAALAAVGVFTLGGGVAIARRRRL